MHFENVNMKRVNTPKKLFIPTTVPVSACDTKNEIRLLKTRNEKLKQNAKMLQFQVKELKLEINKTRSWKAVSLLTSLVD